MNYRLSMSPEIQSGVSSFDVIAVTTLRFSEVISRDLCYYLSNMNLIQRVYVNKIRFFRI